MMMMADGLLGPCSDQVIEGVTVRVESDTELDEDVNDPRMSNGYSNGSNQHMDHHDDYEFDIEEEIVETLNGPHQFSTTSAACANCSMSFFDPIGNPVHNPIYFMCLDAGSNEAIQISSVIHILFAKKLARCPKPSSDLALCATCAEVVARMYQLYRELDSLSAINSYINSFQGDINLFLPTSESSITNSNSSVNYNYAHYEDSISAVISGETGTSSSSTSELTAPTPEVTAGTTTTNIQCNGGLPKVDQKPAPLPEPPPLTLASYYGTPRSTLFSTQELIDKKVYAHGIGLAQPNKPKIEIDELLNSIALSNTSSHIAANSQYGVQVQQQPVQQLPQLANTVPEETQQQQDQGPPQLQRKTPKRKKNVQESSEDGLIPGDLPNASSLPMEQDSIRPPNNTGTTSPDEKGRRQLHCPEEGCSKVYTGRGARASLRQHIKIHHLKQFPFQCNVCLKPIATKAVLDTHAKTHLSIGERAALSNSTPISTRMPTPPRQAPPPEPLPSNPCPECGKVFQTEYILSLHIKNYHKELGDEPIMFKCEYEDCTKQFRDRTGLRRHEQRHVASNTHQVVDIVCSRCSLRFESRKLLKEHQLSCSAPSNPNERQLPCKFSDNCKRTFKYKHHLQNHLMFQHKLSPEEARQEVYPGLAVKDWMVSPRKGQRSPAKQVDRNIQRSEKQVSVNHEAVQPPPPPPPYSLAIQFQTQQQGISHQNPSLNDLRSLPSIDTRTFDQPQLVINKGQDGYSYIQYQHHSMGTTNQDQAFLFQRQNMVGITKTVIQEPGAAQTQYQTLHNALQSLPTVIHQNPSVIQQNPTFFQNSRPASSAPQNDESGRSSVSGVSPMDIQ